MNICGEYIGWRRSRQFIAPAGSPISLAGPGVSAMLLGPSERPSRVGNSARFTMETPAMKRRDFLFRSGALALASAAFPFRWTRAAEGKTKVLYLHPLRRLRALGRPAHRRRSQLLRQGTDKDGRRTRYRSRLHQGRNRVRRRPRSVRGHRLLHLGRPLQPEVGPEHAAHLARRQAEVARLGQGGWRFRRLPCGQRLLPLQGWPERSPEGRGPSIPTSR